jgi:hypothetical protein
MIDDAKQRREFSRWVLLLALYNAHPVGSWEEVLLSTLLAIYPDTTRNEVRRELDYLGDRKLLTIIKHPHGRWFAEINHHGIDVVEYNTDVHPGIARPPKV